MTKINEMKEKNRYEQPLLIKGCTKGVSKNGSPYLNLQLQDDTGTIDAKLWDAKESDEEQIIVGHVAMISCEALEYNKNIQLRVNHVKDMDQSQVALEDYVISSSIPRAVSEQQIRFLLDSFKNENLKKLTAGMLKKVGNRFYEYPAAARIHHNFLGGLAEHTLGMVKAAEEICKLYPQLNRDLLVAGAIVHDLGKTSELSGPFTTEYTEAGKLIGHISIGQGWMAEVAADLGLTDSEEAILLRHMILSHHGQYDYGSPVLPEIQEAEVLYLLDNLDARMNTLRQSLQSVKAGEWTQKIFALENRMFYKPKI